MTYYVTGVVIALIALVFAFVIDKPKHKTHH